MPPQSTKTSTPISLASPLASTDPVTAYARAIVDKKKPAGRHVVLACERHLRDLDDGPKRGLRWDIDEAIWAIGTFRFLRHSKGEWAGKIVELGDWQQFVVGSVFGWKRADGTRRFRTVYEEVPRKNGKSTKLAGIGLVLLVFDVELGAEIYTAATKKDQARIIFGEAQRMVRKSGALLDKVDVFKLNLSVPSTESKFEPLSSDEKTADGLNPSCVLIDELHRHKTRALLDVLDTAMGARKQPLLWIITTAGDESPDSVYAQEHEYARKVVEGLLEDDNTFVYIAAADETDDVFDPVTWAKANPNLGVSVKLDDMQRQAEKARKSPSSLDAFKRLRLNIRTSGLKGGIGRELWLGCGAPVDVASLAGRRCIGGLDLGGKNDLSALVFEFEPIEEGQPADVLPFFWTCSQDLVGREDRDRAPYRKWRDEGFLTVVDGPTVQHDWIAAQIGTLANLYRIGGIALDRYGFDHLGPALEREGIDYWLTHRNKEGKIPTEPPPGAGGLRFVGWGQGFVSMGPAVQALDDALSEKRLRHGMNPVLTWNAANVVYALDPSTDWRKPMKRKSTGRIDGIVALIMARGLASLGTEHVIDINAMLKSQGEAFVI